MRHDVAIRFSWCAVGGRIATSPNGLLAMTWRTEALLESDTALRNRPLGNNPSVSFADTSLYTREALVRAVRYCVPFNPQC